MKRAYVIGPYRADTISDVSQNIEAARSAAEELWRAGFAVFCPHLNSAFMDGVAPDQVFLEGDLAWLRFADFAVAIDGFAHSNGSIGEIDFCSKNNIPVFFSVKKAIESERR